MEIYKAQSLGKLTCGFMGLMIAGQHPEPLTERLENLTAAFESFSKCCQVAGIDVNVRRLRHDAGERRQIAMNVAENQHLHGFTRPGDGCVRLISCMNIPFCNHPSATTFPALSKITR